LVGLWVVVVFKWKEVLRKEDKTRGEEDDCGSLVEWVVVRRGEGDGWVSQYFSK
jgi:hypothetical protein